MANPEHLEILKQGVEVWNQWREENLTVEPDLSGANLKAMNLRGINLGKANLSAANLENSDLTLLGSPDGIYYRAMLDRANLSTANLTFTNLAYAYLHNTNFHSAWLEYTNFHAADLRFASFYGATIMRVDFTHALFERTNFDSAKISSATFGSNDLSGLINLGTVIHTGPSFLGINTIYQSGNKIPENFLTGSGVPDELITYLSSLLDAQKAIQFYSCFISYSTKDGEFARRLCSRMREEKLRVWFAPEDIKGGLKLHEQIERAIQLHDRLLLILSENSMQSEWVMTEIRRARKTEIEETRRQLFPITLVDFDKIKTWKCFDADTGKDLATEVREYYIPDFSNWKDNNSFEKAFDRLLRDLKAEEKNLSK